MKTSDKKMTFNKDTTSYKKKSYFKIEQPNEILDKIN